MGRIFPFYSNKRGQALIEFAFILPLLLVIVGGIVDFGLAFFVGVVIQNAAREGARAGAVIRDSSTTRPKFPDPQSEDCTVPCGSSSPILQVAASKIPDSNLFSGFNLSYDFVDSPPALPNQKSVQVTVEGQHGWFLLQLIGLEPITISRTAEMRWEWQRQPT